MAVWLTDAESKTTDNLMAEVLSLAGETERVQFLVAPGTGGAVVQRMRVALSRSRARQKKRGKNYKEFTLRHDCYPYTTESGKRYDCIVMWIERRRHHRLKEILTDTLKD